MKQKNKIPNIALQDYQVFAVLSGGSNIISFSDNSDIVTDKESNTVPVVPKGKKEPIMFVPRGRNNNMMYDVMRRIGTNVTVSSNVDFHNKVVMGDGVMVYRKFRDKGTGNIVKREVLPSECPEVFEFMSNNNYELVRQEIANDLTIFFDSYVEYVFDRNDPPRLVRVKSKEACCSRVSKLDDKQGRSLWHGYSAEWHSGAPTDLVATPLLDRQVPLYDLKVRMGMEPGTNGLKSQGTDRRFVHNLRINTPGRFYYSRPYWWSVFASGWYDFSSAIPVYKKALIKNQMALRYVIYIKDTFWEKLYKSKRTTEDAEKTRVREAFLQQMNEFLSGEENAGKSFVSEFRYDKIKGFEDKDILINPLAGEKIGGEYIEDSEEVSNTICYAMGVHPSIIGASPGKGKNINGTEARELFMIEQALMKHYQDLTLEPLYVAKAMNHWPEDIFFSVTNCQLVTLDKGSGAVKNTGMTPDVEE